MKSVKKVCCLLSIILILSLTGCEMNTDEADVSDHVQQKNEIQNEDKDPKDGFNTPLPADYEGILSMWGWDDAYFKTVTEAFQEKYPNVKFEYTPIENGDLMQKYKTALITGGELPDIGWAVMAYRAGIFELDMWEPLNQEPYEFDISQVHECVRPQMMNSKEDVCGIEQALAAAGLAYRKDLAKEYLGTDDPKELEAMFPDWQSFIEKGEEIYERSGGEVYLWPGLADAQQFIREQQGVSWIDDDVIRVTDTMKHSLDIVCQFRDSHTSDTLEAWTPEWYEALGKGKHIFTGCATWSVAFEIEQYDPEGKEKGHWGLMSAPEGNILWGGTTLGITKTCKDKRLAWEFIKFATLSTEGAEALNTLGLLTTALKPYEENPALGSYKSPWFGDQDIGRYFLDEIMPDVRTRKMSVNDSVIHEGLNLINASLRKDAGITSEEALQYLKDYLEEELPGYKIE